MERRQFLTRMAAGAVATASACARTASTRGASRPPNVLLVLTDDQGYGDIGAHGNPVLRTPNLDRLRGESLWFDRFRVSPVCSPTRACLMTGRYNYRTGVVDTFQGRSMMHPDEVTLAEALSARGYATGIFGKWHLGDNYPLRPQDQGFEEVLVHRGGGIGQPSDPPGSGYFNPVLQQNGRLAQFEGYCTDVFTDAALRFIETNRNRPFFAYLATNAPHVPLEIADRWVAPYLGGGLDERVAKVYGMVANADANVGRVLDRLAALGLDNDTVVVFLTDNGPQLPPERYNAGMRGAKGTVYEGGIRVPCFVRWPRGLPAGRVDGAAAHIDLMPTLLAACGVPAPDGVAFDGRNLLPQLRREAPWPDRALYFQWHRGDAPELFRNCAAVSGRYKLVEGRELYDLQTDPAEARDLAGDLPDVLARMREDCAAWFADVGATRGYAPPRIHLGTPHENPVVLTRQDWRGAEGWRDNNVGWWEVEVARSGEYDVRVIGSPETAATAAHLRVGAVELEGPVSGGRERVFPARLDPGPARLEAWLDTPDGRRGAWNVEVRRK